MYIQLRNPTEVLTEWSVKREDFGSTHGNVFEANPTSGTLQPEEFCNIQVFISKQVF